MDESQIINELCAALDDEAATVRAPAKAAERARTKARKRRLTRGLVSSVPVAGLAVGLVIAMSGPQAPARQHTPKARVTQAAQLTVVQVLNRAAASALAQPAAVPRPDQFVYSKAVYSAQGATETWRSVDGARNGFVLSGDEKVMLWGCSNGRQTVQPDPGSDLKRVTQSCIATPAYLAGMPTTASAMGSYLAQTFGSSVRDAAVAQKVTQFVFNQDYLLPAQRAALYRFFVTIPGLKVVPRMRDYVGRPGVGISLTTDGFTVIWIFDPKTFAYLGSTELVGSKFTFGSAVLKTVIVNEAGQRS